MLGVAVLASIFARYGGYESPQTFDGGLVPALWIVAIVVGAGSVVALIIPHKRPASETVARDGASDRQLVPELEAA